MHSQNYSGSFTALVETGEASDEEDGNPDERVSQRDTDRKIACDEELSDSDDESGGRRNVQTHAPSVCVL